MFAYTYQTIDDQKGSNHDGQVQRGEQVRTLVTVKNIGKGRAMHTEAVLRNGTGQEGILISAGRFEAKELAPGETKTFSFVYEVRPDFKGDEYQLELAVGDTTLGESVTDKIKVKVAPAGPAPEPLTGDGTVARDDAPLREAAADSALVVGRAPKGTRVQDHAASWARSRASTSRATASAFVATADVEGGRRRPRHVEAGVAGHAAGADGDRADGGRWATPCTSRARPRTIAWCATSTCGSGTATRRCR